MKINRYVARRLWMKNRKKVKKIDKNGYPYTVYEPSWTEFKQDYLNENSRSINR